MKRRNTLPPEAGEHVDSVLSRRYCHPPISENSFAHRLEGQIDSQKDSLPSTAFVDRCTTQYAPSCSALLPVPPPLYFPPIALHLRISFTLEVRQGDDLFQVAKWHLQRNGLGQRADIVLGAFLEQVSQYGECRVAAVTARRQLGCFVFEMH